MSEIVELKKCQKKLKAIMDIIQAVQSHGYDSDDFKAAYDTALTPLDLEPRVTLDMPSHLVFARHAMDVRSTLTMDRFLACISSSALLEAGCPDIARQQVN
jgi:hypothetical protein